MVGNWVQLDSTFVGFGSSGEASRKAVGRCARLHGRGGLFVVSNFFRPENT